MQREVVIMNMDYSSDQKKAANEKPPVFRNMTISNVTGDGAPTAILITGVEDSPIENIRFENMNIRSEEGVVANFAKGLVFSNVNITPAKGISFDLANASGIVIEKSTAAAGTKQFLKVSGKSSGIKLLGNDLSNAKEKVSTSAEVSANAVTIE
jgi:hypothetical protein